MLRKIQNICKRTNPYCDECSIEKECRSLFEDSPIYWDPDEILSIEKKLLKEDP